MSWHFLERWLEKANQHSTLLGKFWITLLIVCRMIVIGTLGDRVYADEQSEFRCSTSQAGCTNVCFDKFSPISHIRFWGFQIILVSLPSVLFILYSGHKAKIKLDAEKEKSSKEKAEAKEKEKINKNEANGGNSSHPRLRKVTDAGSNSPAIRSRGPRSRRNSGCGTPGMAKNNRKDMILHNRSMAGNSNSNRKLIRKGSMSFRNYREQTLDGPLTPIRESRSSKDTRDSSVFLPGPENLKTVSETLMERRQKLKKAYSLTHNLEPSQDFMTIPIKG